MGSVRLFLLDVVFEKRRSIILPFLDPLRSTEFDTSQKYFCVTSSWMERQNASLVKSPENFLDSIKRANHRYIS